MGQNNVRHKVFISYHVEDLDEVNEFINTFDKDRKVFITRVVGAGMSDEIINSDDTDYVISKIRKNYLKDSTVTIVMLGKCTWSRKFVDWELQASLRQGDVYTPNGLLGIKLPSYNRNGYPDRLNKNLKKPGQVKDCYARILNYPKRKDTLQNAIEDAFQARKNRNGLIFNPRERFINNRNCK